MGTKLPPGRSQFQPLIARTQTVHRPVGPVAYDCVTVILVRDGSALLLSEFGKKPVKLGDVIVLSLGAGTSLAFAAMQSCRVSGDRTLSLRVGEGTSWAAFDLYKRLGFNDPEEPKTATGPGVAIGRRQDPSGTEQILRALPTWFGIDEAIQNYVQDATSKASYVAVDNSVTVGVALLEPHYPESVELYLIAVHPDYRGRGIGTKLVTQVEADLREQGISLLQVKTVGESFEHAGYGETRSFYRSCGFLSLEELTGISWNGPTVIMVKSLRC